MTTKEQAVRCLSDFINSYSGSPSTPLNQSKVRRILRRRGYSIDEWRAVPTFSPLPKYTTQVYWEGSYLGTLDFTEPFALIFTSEVEDTFVEPEEYWTQPCIIGLGLGLGYKGTEILYD